MATTLFVPEFPYLEGTDGSLCASLNGYVELFQKVFTFCKGTGLKGVGHPEWGITSCMYIDHPRYRLSHPNAPVNPVVYLTINFTDVYPHGAAAIANWTNLNSTHYDRFMLQMNTFSTLKDNIVAAIPPRHLDGVFPEGGSLADVTIADILAHLRQRLAIITWEVLEDLMAQLRVAYTTGHFRDFLMRHSKLHETAFTFGFPIQDWTKTSMLQNSLIQSPGWLKYVREFRQMYPSITSCLWVDAKVIFAAYDLRRLTDLATAPITPAPIVMVQEPATAAITVPKAEVKWITYCWTHGPSTNPTHTSQTCTTPATGHIRDASLTNRCNGTVKSAGGGGKGRKFNK